MIYIYICRYTCEASTVWEVKLQQMVCTLILNVNNQRTCLLLELNGFFAQMIRKYEIYGSSYWSFTSNVSASTIESGKRLKQPADPFPFNVLRINPLTV